MYIYYVNEILIYILPHPKPREHSKFYKKTSHSNMFVGWDNMNRKKKEEYDIKRPWFSNRWYVHGFQQKDD